MSDITPPEKVSAEAPKTSSKPITRYEEVLLNEAREKRKSGNLTGAISSFQEFLLRYESLIDNTEASIVHGEVAELCFFRGEYHVARTHCEKSLHFDGRNDLAHILLGKIAVAEYRFSQARSHFSAVNEANPGRWLGMTLIAIKLRKNNEAEVALVKAHERLPADYPEYVVLAAYVMLLQGDTGQAISIARASLKACKGDVFLTLLLGEMFMTAGHYGEALAAANQVAVSAPENDQMNAIRAHAAYAQEEYHEARTYANEAVSRNSRNAYAKTILMKLAVREGRYDEAEHIGHSIIRDVPEYSLAHANLGDVYFAQGRYELAQIEYEQTGQLMDAKTKGARLRQARVAFVEQDYVRAAQLLQELVESAHSYYDDAMCDLVLCYDRLGREDEKEKLLDKMHFRKTFFKRTEELLKYFEAG